MITLLHGDLPEASRNELHKRKELAKGKDVRSLDGRTITEAQLTQTLQSNSMFGGTSVVFIENMFGKLGKKIKLVESLCKIIRESGADVVLWEEKEVGTTVIKNLGNAEVVLFKTPAVIFQFLDGLAPQNAQNLIPIYQNLILTEPPELIFSMIARRLRQLIQLTDGVTPTGLQGWQVSRLTRQAKLFTMNRLVSMYKKLLEMEYSIKSGSSPFTISRLTEQFLIDL